MTRILGPAKPPQFTRHPDRLTVDNSGPAGDYSLRRMILHYANLCVLAGGVDLFLLGCELRGLEAIRGPGRTKAGTIGEDGTVTWDYPCVDGLGRLADDLHVGRQHRDLATIKLADATGLTLTFPLPALPAPGDTFTAYQGCDYTLATCRSKFANEANFRGFPFVPAPEAAF